MHADTRLSAGVSRTVLPDFTDSVAAATEWEACAHLIAGGSAMRLMVRQNGRAAYPAGAQRPLSPQLPNAPAAVMLWDRTRRLPMLALDFDAKNGHGPRSTERDAQAALQLLAEVGLHPVADRAPTGGWHVYARLPQPAAGWEVRQLATALGRLWPTLDPSPLLNPEHGCIRPPGSAHRTSGYQRLAGPVAEAVAALTRTPAAEGWKRLRDRVGATHIQTPAADFPAEMTRAAVGACRRSINATADQLARTGQHPTREFPSPSEARFSVIRSAVNAGWSLSDVDLALRGPWAWLRTSYGSKHHSALARDFHKARNQRTHELRKRTVRISDTSQPVTQGGSPSRFLPGSDDPHLALRKFTTHTRNHRRHRGYSPRLRAVLDAVIWAGHVQGRIYVNVGVRSLAEQSGVHYDTVACALHELAADGLLVRISTGRGRDADVWRINVELGHGQRPARGRRVGLRRVFRVLGGHLVGEVYEALVESPTPLQTGDLARILGYDRRRVYEALLLLGGWDLASSSQHLGWTVGAADPTALARRLGGWDDWKQQHDHHQAQRAMWRTFLERHREPQVPSGQLLLDELEAAAPDSQTWIEEFASGTSPPEATVITA